MIIEEVNQRWLRTKKQNEIDALIKKSIEEHNKRDWAKEFYLFWYSITSWDAANEREERKKKVLYSY